MRSVYLQRNKKIFKATELPAEEFAHSLGLAGVPKIKFITQAQAAEAAKAKKLDALKEPAAEEEKKDQVKTKYDRMFQRKNQDILSEHYNKLVDFNDAIGKGEDEDFFTVNRVNHDLSGSEDDEAEMREAHAENLSKRQAKMTKKEKAKRAPKGERIVFDEEGKVSKQLTTLSKKENANRNHNDSRINYMKWWMNKSSSRQVMPNHSNKLISIKNPSICKKPM